MTEQQSAPTPAEVVGARINALMWHKRVSQRTVANALGIAQGGVSRRLRGQTEISVGELFVFAQLLGVTPAELVSDNGPATLSISVTGPSGVLPRLDSNQQPSGYRSAQVSVVVDLAAERAARRERVAS